MNKAKFVVGLLIALGVLILVGGALVGYYTFFLKEDEVVYIDLSDEGTETLSFDKLDLVPGEKAEYTVILKSELDGKHKVSLDFKDNNKEMNLKDYAYVTLRLNGTEICNRLLAEVLDGEVFETEIELKANSEAELEIIYYLPESVGNEAENAEADFELNIIYTNN